VSLDSPAGRQGRTGGDRRSPRRPTCSSQRGTQIHLLCLIQVSDGLFMWTGEALLPKINLGAQFHALSALSLAWRSSCADLGFAVAAGTEFPRTW
jgi:hypothetical protein